MLDDKISALDSKVGSLLDELRRLRKENVLLSTELESSSRKLESAGQKIQEVEALRDHNAELQQRLGELEAEAASGDSKESEIRERLQYIIRKIDEIEQESGNEE